VLGPIGRIVHKDDICHVQVSILMLVLNIKEVPITELKPYCSGEPPTSDM
jgi:hypothetical protein